MLERMAGGPGEDKDALAHRMGDLALLEPPVLHGGEQVLQPGVVLGVELVEKGDRQIPFERGVPHLVEGADEVLRSVELRQVEFQPAGPSHDGPGQLLHGKGLAGTGRAEDADGKGLVGAGAVAVGAHQPDQEAEGFDFFPVDADQGADPEMGKTLQGDHAVAHHQLGEIVRRLAGTVPAGAEGFAKQAEGRGSRVRCRPAHPDLAQGEDGPGVAAGDFLHDAGEARGGKPVRGSVGGTVPAVHEVVHGGQPALQPGFQVGRHLVRGNQQPPRHRGGEAGEKAEHGPSRVRDVLALDPGGAVDQVGGGIVRGPGLAVVLNPEGALALEGHREVPTGQKPLEGAAGAEFGCECFQGILPGEARPEAGRGLAELGGRGDDDQFAGERRACQRLPQRALQEGGRRLEYDPPARLQRLVWPTGRVIPESRPAVRDDHHIRCIRGRSQRGPGGGPHGLRLSPEAHRLRRPPDPFARAAGTGHGPPEGIGLAGDRHIIGQAVVLIGLKIRGETYGQVRGIREEGLEKAVNERGSAELVDLAHPVDPVPVVMTAAFVHMVIQNEVPGNQNPVLHGGPLPPSP